MHQNAFGGRAPPGPTGGAYSRPLSWIQGKGWEGRERKEKKMEGGEGREKEEEGRGKGKGPSPQKKILAPPL